ncbi:hypothetical protein ACROYT_G041287 [Oculina patagonica]
MNEYVLLSFSSFVYFTSRILDEGICDASGRFHRDERLTYAVFKDHLFHDLDVPIVEATIAENERNCLLRCVKHFQCFSTNIAAFSLPNGTVLCVLLSTDKYSAPEKFRANHSFHHFSIVSPCESFPCQNGGTCRPLYEIDDYNCSCRGSWIGKNCEIKPRTTCKEVYDENLATGNKVYPLQLGSDVHPVYCHMTDDLGACGSGGWTLVMKMDGNQMTFHYNSDLWSNKNTYNILGGKTGLDLQETKLPTYWNTNFSKICLGMKIGQQFKFIAINKQANSLYSLIADGKYRATSLGRNTWKTLIGSQASLQLYCNKEGFNAASGDTALGKARIGILGDNKINCYQCDSRIGFGTGGRHDDSNTCGNEALDGSSSDNGGKHIKAMGYILVQ